MANKRGNRTYGDFMRFQKYYVKNSLTLKEGVNWISNLPTSSNSNGDCRYVVSNWLFYLWMESERRMIPNLKPIGEAWETTESTNLGEVLVSKANGIQIYTASGRSTLIAVSS